MNLPRAIEYFLAAKRAKGLSKATLRTYSDRLYRFAREMPEVEEVEELDKYAIEKYLGGMLGSGIKQVSVNSAARTLSTFCSWAFNEELMRTNPFKSERKRVEFPKAPRTHIETISDPDFLTLLKSCDRSTEKGRRDEAILAFLYDTGVRVSELVGLKKDDIDMKSRTAAVYGKGGKWRSVFFSAETAIILGRYFSRRRDGSPWAFTGHRDRRMSPFGINQMLARRKVATGVTSKVNPHNFRHTFATNFLRAGGGIAQLVRLLGHADPGLTLRTYTHLVTTDLSAAHAEYSPMSRVVGRR